MKDLHRIKRLNSIFLPLVSRRSHILMETLKMGYPHFYDSDDENSTAYVQSTADGRVRFCWNRKFFDSISDLAVEYVAFHEALHLVLNHCGRRKGRVPIVWNIACDLVVNRELDEVFRKLMYREYLNLSRYKSPNIISRYDVNNDPFLKKRLSLRFHPFISKTTEQIYDILMKEAKITQNKNQTKLTLSLQGYYGKQVFNYTIVDEHHWDKDQGLPIDVEKRLGELRSIGRRKKHSRSSSAWGSMATVDDLKEAALSMTGAVPWTRILSKRFSSVVKSYEGDSWARPHRKLYRLYPHLLLPGLHESDQLTSSIFVAIDTSGSIGEDQILQLIGIAKTLPTDKYEVNYAWFDTRLYQLNENDLTCPIGGGGTSFQAIEDVLVGKHHIFTYSNHSGWVDVGSINRYPDVVVVLTDGYASCPELEYPERWIFVVIPEGDTSTLRELEKQGTTILKIDS